MAKKSSWAFRLSSLFLLGLIGTAVLGIYLIGLDVKIRSKFESHRWNLPSRVYSDSFHLYPGLAISPERIESKLIRLGYKKAPASKGIGEYAKSSNLLTVFLRNFSYPAEEFTGFPVKVEFAGGKIAKIVRLDGDETLKALKIEPELIASIFDEKMEDRTLVKLDEIPEDLQNAVIAVEDERFYRHHGIDPKSILRAILMDILHFKALQGGSTLTQQLVKNYFLSPEKTFIRKFNEMLMAILLEVRYSKEEILEAYLNEIYFGQRGPVSITGVEEASKHYFGKGVSHLELAESALLAGLIRLPGEYSPFRNMKKAVERRDLVLRQMLDQGMISEAEHAAATKKKVILPQGTSEHRGHGLHFIDFVQRELKENYPPEILQSEGLRIFTTLDLETQEIAEAAVQKRLEDLETSRPKQKKLKEEGKTLEAAFLALQPQTGAIRAFVGGRDFGESQFDRVVDAHRQPGSAFKPFVYLTALKAGEEGSGESWTLASTIEDSRFTTKLGGKSWTPENYDKKEHGTVTLREALENSYNISTAKLAIDVGLEKVVATARAAGIESPLQPYPSLALGAFEVTPLELARAYTIFPNQGTRTEPVAIMNVVTRDGEVLEKKGYKMKKVTSPEMAYLVTSALKGVFDRGTAASARKMGFTGLAAGKTGTTSDYKDSWFVGYTPDVLALAWVGYDDNTPSGLSGSSGALPVWVEFMKRLNPPGASKPDFPATENILLVKVTRNGKLYKDDCGEPFEEAFLKGTVPESYCDEESSP